MSDDPVMDDLLRANVRIFELEEQLRAAEEREGQARARLERSKKLQQLTLENELQWMRKHEELVNMNVRTEQPHEDRITELETQLRAAEESNGKLREALEYISENRTCGALDDCSHARCNSTHVVKMFARAALASAPTQGEGITHAD